jgi:drug/metabolite transporter (DMT)-like permease
MIRPVSRTGTIMCLASGAAFGAMAIFGKLAYAEGTTAGTLLVVRFALAAALFWGIALATGAARGLRALSRRDVATGLGLGAFGYAIQAGCFFAALERIDASLLSLVLYTFPAMVAASAVAIGRERMDAARLAALGLAFAGLVLVLTGAGAGTIDAVGVTLAVGAAVVYTAYILVSDGLVGRMRPELLPALICSGAVVPLVVVTTLLGQLRPAEVTAAGWGWLVCLTAVSTVLAITLFFAGLRRVGPTRTSILATVEPVVTVVLAYLVFGEVLGAAQVIGATLVLAAVPVLHAGELLALRAAEAT